jgi:uncharacterized membrane protein YdjX (TVP38/TMEM64 family)
MTTPALAAPMLGLAFPPVFDQLWFFLLYLFVDALAFPLASTVYVAYLGTVHPPVVVAILGALGTAGGSVGQYLVVRALLTRPRGLPAWLVRLRGRLERAVDAGSAATFWALFVIYATPLGAGPLRLVAAAGGYPLPRFALAILLGCLPYYFALAWLGDALRLPAWVYAVLIVAVLAVGLAQWLVRRGRVRHGVPTGDG